VNALSDVRKNQTFAASPHVLEEFPELARPAQPARVLSEPVITNRAYAASPRAMGEFPWLARGNYTVTQEPFQIAPLK
jgi:hypothetical protein